MSKKEICPKVKVNHKTANKTAEERAKALEAMKKKAQEYAEKGFEPYE